jgi:hypothetical protein
MLLETARHKKDVYNKSKQNGMAGKLHKLEITGWCTVEWLNLLFFILFRMPISKEEHRSDYVVKRIQATTLSENPPCAERSQTSTLDFHGLQWDTDLYFLVTYINQELFRDS